MAHLVQLNGLLISSSSRCANEKRSYGGSPHPKIPHAACAMVGHSRGDGRRNRRFKTMISLNRTTTSQLKYGVGHAQNTQKHHIAQKYTLVLTRASLKFRQSDRCSITTQDWAHQRQSTRCASMCAPSKPSSTHRIPAARSGPPTATLQVPRGHTDTDGYGALQRPQQERIPGGGGASACASSMQPRT